MAIDSASSVEKFRVEQYYGEPAAEVSCSEYPIGRLVVWKNLVSLPTRKICTFLSNDGELVVPNESEEVFIRLLTRLVVYSADAEGICELVSLISPALRQAVVSVLPYMQFRTSWHSPELRHGEFEGFFENLTAGQIERLSVSSSGQVLIENVGKGMTFWLR